MKDYPSPPTWQLKPFTEHIDGGFGALGDAFCEGASRLAENVAAKPFLNSSLPIAYLYRHAAELYLKSCIIVLHRSLGIPFNEKQRHRPAIKVGDDWVPVHRVHSVQDLYTYLTTLVKEHSDTLSQCTTTDWNTIPDELNQWISQIEEFDSRSTFFRYPGVADELKSDFRKSSVAEILSSMAPERDPVKGFLQFDENDNLVAAFCLDPSRLQPIIDVLRSVSETLSTLHFALRSELANGS